MARRNLLTRHERERLFLPRTDHFSIVRNYTLVTEDLDAISKRRGRVNRLGVVVHLALLRHPGFGLRANSDIPSAILSYLAAQLCVSPDIFEHYGQRPQTRTDHSAAAANILGLHPFTRTYGAYATRSRQFAPASTARDSRRRHCDGISIAIAGTVVLAQHVNAFGFGFVDRR